MIPQLVTVIHRRPGGRPLRLHVPVLLVLLVLAPLLPLIVLGALIACLATRVRPIGAARDVGRLLWALPGTEVEVEQGRSAVLVSIK